MRKSRKNPVLHMDFSPAPSSVRLLSQTVFSYFLGFPIMEFMSPDTLSLPQITSVCFCSYIHVPETDQPLFLFCTSFEQSYHRIKAFVRSLKLFQKIQKPSAFCDTRHSLIQLFFQILSHGCIGRKLSGIDFRISSAKQYPICLFRYLAILQRTEPDQPTSKRFQNFQIFWAQNSLLNKK